MHVILYVFNRTSVNSPRLVKSEVQVLILDQLNFLAAIDFPQMFSLNLLNFVTKVFVITHPVRS